jgi:hypothetical protein
MPKTRISRAELCDKVLAAIRQQPGCEAAREVAVTAVEVLNSPESTTWHVTVIDSGGVKFEIADHAAKRAQHKLCNLFDLEA